MRSLGRSAGLGGATADFNVSDIENRHSVFNQLAQPNYGAPVPVLGRGCSAIRPAIPPEPVPFSAHAVGSKVKREGHPRTGGCPF